MTFWLEICLKILCVSLSQELKRKKEGRGRERKGGKADPVLTTGARVTEKTQMQAGRGTCPGMSALFLERMSCFLDDHCPKGQLELQYHPCLILK